MSDRIAEMVKRANSMQITVPARAKSDLQQERLKVTAKQRAIVVKAFGEVCLKCGGKERIQIDHVVAHFDGGEHGVMNFQPLCAACNVAKGKRCSKGRDYRPVNWKQLILDAMEA